MRRKEYVPQFDIEEQDLGQNNSLDIISTINKRIGMKWFDFYYRSATPVFVILHTIALINYIGRKYYIEAALMSVSVIINASLIYLFRPYKKICVRNYPKKILYLTIADSIYWLVTWVLNGIAYSAIGLFDYSFIAFGIVPLFIMNIIYFTKRRVYFHSKEDTDIISQGSSENTDINKQEIDKPEIITNTDSSEEKTLFCRKCGKSLPLDSDFCVKCGARVVK